MMSDFELTHVYEGGEQIKGEIDPILKIEVYNGFANYNLLDEFEIIKDLEQIVISKKGDKDNGRKNNTR